MWLIWSQQTYIIFFLLQIYSFHRIFFDMSTGVEIFLISYFLEKYNIRSIREICQIKYLDWKILNFWFRKK